MYLSVRSLAPRLQLSINPTPFHPSTPQHTHTHTHTHTQSRDDGSVLWDNERNNGSTYYYYPEKSPPECSVINFPVGILRPDWLSGAKYKGVEEYNGQQVRVCIGRSVLLF